MASSKALLVKALKVGSVVLSSSSWMREVSAQSSCTAIEVTGAGDLSGTYYQDETLARPTFYRSGGVDLYSVYPDTLTGLWKMRPTVKETVPVYEATETLDDVSHPADITGDWTMYESAIDDGTLVSDVSITCATDTTSDVEISSCNTVEVSGAGDHSGTFTYDEETATYTRYAGSELYGIFINEYNDAWTLSPTGLENYPIYESFDDAEHPADITQDWVLTESFNADGETISDLTITCGVAEDAGTTATCATIDIAGAGEKSGTYEWDGCGTVSALSEYTGTVNTFSKTAEDGSSYVLAVNADLGGAWELGGLPLYRTFDAAEHPVDISQDWIAYDSYSTDGIAVSDLTISCAAGSPSLSDEGYGDSTCKKEASLWDRIMTWTLVLVGAIIACLVCWCGRTHYVRPGDTIRVV